MSAVVSTRQEPLRRLGVAPGRTPIRLQPPDLFDPNVPGTTAAIVARQRYSDVHVALGAEDRALWCMMEPQGRPSFTWPLLDDLARIRDLIDALFMATSPSAARPFDYLVLGSRAPGIFNLGGDLALFAEHIRAGDRTALSEYARACVMAVYANHSGHNHGVVTISLIQGDALGGGLEAALSSDVLVAERQAKLGLPEVLFNLFPGMGAYSFLSRRIGMVKAEEVILSGRLYTAAEMHALGMIDVLAEEGEGEAAVRAYIARHRAHWRAQSTLYGVRRRINPVSLDELIDVTDMWVDAALGMSEQDLRRMTRIAAVQDRSRRTAG